MAKSFRLYSPPSDFRQLLPSIVASATGKSLEIITPSEELGNRNSTIISGDFYYITDNGTFLYEPSSVARYFARMSQNPSLLPSNSFEHEKWLEWEEVVLRPAVKEALQKSRPLPEEIVSQLVDAVAEKNSIVGDQLSLADFAIWTSLYPVLGASGIPCEALEAWFRKLADSPPVSEGLKVALSGKPPEHLIKSFTSKTIEMAAAGESANSSSKVPFAPNTEVPILPVPGKRNILVTSALPYVNNVPHLGNIIGCVLSADVYARYCRRRGYNVIYMCGTDEYGTATETKAMAEKTTPQAICDKYHAIHRDIYKWFDISFDKFGRTSTPKQTEICQSIFQSLMEEKKLLEDTMEQPYCDTCLRFLADRFVEGTCPTPGCGYEDARGDQCDKCGKLLNPTELINPRCNVCGNTPRIRQTEHLFLDLPSLKDELENYVSTTAVAGGWSQNSVQTTNAWIRDGLKPRCITRDLKWGVPVPLEKYKDKVFYVWFDAPIGYLSITANYTDQWKEWWQKPEDVELVQFMGKDNVPFHTVIFPCTLLGTRQPWTLMRTISVTEYLNYEGGKFSKSRGVGVFGNDVTATAVPVEVWRYYLLTNRPEVSDTMFTWADLQAKQNNELLKNLGNFVNRALAFVAKPEGEGYGSVVPDATDADKDELTANLGQKVGELVKEYIDNMEKVKLKSGLKAAMAVSSAGNVYLQDSKFWKLFKEDKPRCDVVLRSALGLVHLLATLLEPFMPSFSLKVLHQLNLPEASLTLNDQSGERPWEALPPQHRIGVPEPIFQEMADAEVAAYRERFAGSQSDRAKLAETAAASSANQSVATGGASAGPAAVSEKGKGKGAVKDEKKGSGSQARGAQGEAEGKKTKAEKGKKKEEKEEKKEEKEAVDISRLDIRVGRIVRVEKHPDADTLYVEEIDVGEGKPRTVVSGLVKFVPIEEMQERMVCVLSNLKPANMRGIKSHAMVLAASNADHTKVELVLPPKGSKPGDQITAVGFPGKPDALLNPKKKIWEGVQPDLKTGEDLVAMYKGAALATPNGVCTVATLKGASIA